ncbi:hypothetical protein Tco_0679918 [Tanacetum coccineum]|uniref:Uncharacterized protein n=1 Tax=Tanacetum coccineum TaxID=301880 RepID=A0ABQ4XJF2_9ASTR
MENANPPSPPKIPISLILKKICKFNSFLESLNLVPPSSNTQFICTKENDGDIMFVELIKKYDDSSEEELEEDDNVVTREELGVEYFDKFPTRSELVYHKYLMCASIPSLFLRNPIIVGGRIPTWVYLVRAAGVLRRRAVRGVVCGYRRCMITGHLEVAIFIALSLGLIQKVLIFKSSLVWLIQVVLEVKVHAAMGYMRTRNEEDKRRGVDYVMNKILGFYKECLELGPEYLTGLEGSGSSSSASEGVT